MLLLHHVQQSLHHTIITFVGHVAADDEDHVETIVGMRLLDGALDGLHTIDDHRGIHMVVGDMAEHFVADVDIRFGIGVFGGEYETRDAILCGLDDFLPADPATSVIRGLRLL